MDSQSVAVIARPGPTADDAVRCDQAVFTSVRTSAGQGYRLIAASRGLSPEEKNEISARSPSHAGLCDDSEHARAASFQALKSGRLCASLSRTAGHEQTGRGGLRIYTRVAVFDAAALSRFGDNPFNVFRAMEGKGLDRPELSPSPTLPPLALPPPKGCTRDTWTAATAMGPQWLSYLLSAAMNHRSLIVAGEGAFEDALEAVVLALPAVLRKRVSFSQGLKFSIGRPFTLSEMTGDTAATERIIRGHAITLVRPAASTPPSVEMGHWERMAEEYWSEGEYDSLVQFTSQAFPDCSRAALDRIAGLRLEVNRASVMDAAELLSVADRRLAKPETGAIESRLLADLLATMEIRLDKIWSSGAASELTPAWPAVRTLVRKSPTASRHALPLAGIILRRMAALAPLTALDYALDLAREPNLTVIGPELRKVLSAAEQWGMSATRDELLPVLEKLKRWRQAFPQIEQVGPALERLTARTTGH